MAEHRLASRRISVVYFLQILRNDAMQRITPRLVKPNVIGFVAQWNRARVSEARCRGFESLLTHTLSKPGLANEKESYPTLPYPSPYGAAQTFGLQNLWFCTQIFGLQASKTGPYKSGGFVRLNKSEAFAANLCRASLGRPDGRTEFRLPRTKASLL